MAAAATTGNRRACCACISRFSWLRQPGSKQTRRCLHKELASIPDTAWRSGQRKGQQAYQPSGKQAAATKRIERRGPLFGNSHAVYGRKDRGPKIMPRFVALGSDMHRALAEMPLTRQGVRFNPWTILLELLNDTRLSCRVDNNKLLIAMSHLGWVTPDNIMRQRPLFAKYLLSSGCLSTLPRFSTLLPDNITLPADEASAKFSGTDLTPSQLMSLCQMQWPRFIAQKYQQALSVQQLDAVPADQGRFEKQADWNRAWLSANLSMIELRAALKKRQVVFGGSMDDREQFQLLFRGAFESAPGLALNIIMCWGGEYSDILNPYSVGRLSETYFASPETAKQAIGQAWQMYDWLLYCNPQWPLPIELDADTPASQRRSQRVAHATSSHIFASLGAFDSWKEATQSLDRLYRLLRRKWAAESEGPNHSDRSQGAVQSLAASDQRLAERYIKLQSQHSSS